MKIAINSCRQPSGRLLFLYVLVAFGHPLPLPLLTPSSSRLSIAPSPLPLIKGVETGRQARNHDKIRSSGDLHPLRQARQLRCRHPRSDRRPPARRRSGLGLRRARDLFALPDHAVLWRVLQTWRDRGR